MSAAGSDAVGHLSPEELLALLRWRSFYHERYAFMGRLAGPFYYRNGSPTPLLAAIQRNAAAAETAERAAAAPEHADHAPCGVRWSEEAGSTVWCPNGRRPRQAMAPPSASAAAPTVRCSCFEGDGYSDLRRLYPGCAPDASECSTVARASAAPGA
jgi:hypothetical protein